VQPEPSFYRDEEIVRNKLCFNCPQCSLGIYINIAACMREIDTNRNNKERKSWWEGVAVVFFLNTGFVKISIFVEEFKRD